MTLEEKREYLDRFCEQYPECEIYDPLHIKCPLYDTKCDWDGTNYHNEKEIDKMYSIACQPVNANTNPYWNNITKIAEKQRAKGMVTYGQGLEDNNKPTIDRITYIEEELVDALMYLEWLKENIKDGR